MSQLKGQTLQNESAKRQTLQVLQISLVNLELVSKELNHFGVIADLFRQIGCHRM